VLVVIVSGGSEEVGSNEKALPLVETLADKLMRPLALLVRRLGRWLVSNNLQVGTDS